MGTVFSCVVRVVLRTGVHLGQHRPGPGLALYGAPRSGARVAEPSRWAPGPDPVRGLLSTAHGTRCPGRITGRRPSSPRPATTSTPWCPGGTPQDPDNHHGLKRT
ncbi:hypothetical protein KTU01_17670 [Kocuria turfanensis]|uniref:Uncharacterized protein n=1 Tax=Kocuria turfanensis TaxID=388357 RepID=A0A512ID60_9MICC|nr:hypothetical protein KTU01_17670 [Kocuria turfanensis]